MKENCLHTAFIVLLFFSSLGLAEDNEDYPVINSNAILTSEYLSSTYHRIDSIDINNDYYHFIVESDIGRYDIHSLALLKKRVDEIKTISRAINEYQQQDEEFSGELRSQLRISSDSAVDLLTKPISSVSNLAGQLAGNINATLAGEDAFIYQSSSRPSYEPKDPTSATHKRNVAFQLGLDTYTNNTRVQSFLNTVAAARSSGKVSAGVGLSNAIRNVNEIDLKIKFLIKKKTLAELNLYNTESLFNIGINQALAKEFIAYSGLSPTNKTVITAYLSRLESVVGLDEFIKLSLAANTELKASLIERLSKMLWQYNSDIESISRFSNYNDKVTVITNSGKIVFFDTADLLIWSEVKQNRYQASAKYAETSGYRAWEIVSLGELSSLARQNMNALAFNIQTLSAE
jgi:hypothetical protein